MAYHVSSTHPLHRLFHGLTEHAFHAELGIADVRLVDYMADLLTRFVPSEGVWRVTDRRGRRLSDVAEMLAEADTADDARRRECLRHVGDYTLFWTGVFPEAIRPTRSPLGPDALIDYCQQGKRSYLLASTYYDDDAAPVLRRLGSEFELCAYGLSRVRQEWERLDAPGAGDGRPVVIG